MGRSFSTRNLLDKRPGRILSIKHKELSAAIGAAERKGCWLVYGAEKNGKTWLSAKLAAELSTNESVWYISAEEGLDVSFQNAVMRAGVTSSVKVKWDEYLPLADIIVELRTGSKRRVGVVFIDNLTIYRDEITPSKLKKELIDAFPDKLFVLIAHEERKQPDGALARMVSKMAKVILRVQGLSAFVISRYSVGGQVVIEENKSELFHGDNH